VTFVSGGWSAAADGLVRPDELVLLDGVLSPAGRGRSVGRVDPWAGAIRGPGRRPWGCPDRALPWHPRT